MCLDPSHHPGIRVHSTNSCAIVPDYRNATALFQPQCSYRKSLQAVSETWSVQLTELLILKGHSLLANLGSLSTLRWGSDHIALIWVLTHKGTCCILMFFLLKGKSIAYYLLSMYLNMTNISCKPNYTMNDSVISLIHFTCFYCSCTKAFMHF